MDLAFSPQDEAFRQEVQEFLRSALPEDIRSKMMCGEHITRSDLERWTRILAEKGWGAPGWPVEYGGPGWTDLQEYIFTEELNKAPAPALLSYGIKMVGPVIAEFGTEAQKAHFLPRIITLEDWWCQGFSEPGAGSDLASLKTRALRDGDFYIVNGQKIWTSQAQDADWIFCLVRTDNNVKKQLGISFLLIDMKSPGLTLRPIQLVDGSHEVNEIFFDNVRVPVGNLVGEENRGWDYAKFLLGLERNHIAAVGVSKERLKRVRERAALVSDDATRLRFEEKICVLEIELKALEITQLRLIENAASGADMAAMSSILKIRGSEIQQATAALLFELAGPEAASYRPEANGDWLATAAPNYFNASKYTIYGGSNEIQRTILANVVLGR